VDDGITCDCCSPLEPGLACKKKGWAGLPKVSADGLNWPLDMAAKLLEIPEKDLRDLVRILGLPASGPMKTSPYRRSGRNPRVYSGSKLIKICEAMRKLALEL